MDNDKQQKASERMSLFLETFFTAMNSLGIEMYITKEYDIVLRDKETNLAKRFTPAELQALYDKWKESFEKNKGGIE